MRPEVKELGASTCLQWDDYVQRSSDSTFFHRAGWKIVLERAFGHKAHFLYAEEAGTIVGILPLAQVKSALFGHSLSSLPFCVYGGIVADTDEAASALREAACDAWQTTCLDAELIKTVCNAAYLAQREVKS